MRQLFVILTVVLASWSARSFAECPEPGNYYTPVGYGEEQHNHNHQPNNCDFYFYCDTGLVAFNSGVFFNNYARLTNGWFSCWYNTPEVRCSDHSIAGYDGIGNPIWVRKNYWDG